MKASIPKIKAATLSVALVPLSGPTLAAEAMARLKPAAEAGQASLPFGDNDTRGFP